MPRPNFTVSLPGTCLRSSNINPSGTWINVSDARYSKETTVGVSRRKPKGWIPPTPYTFAKEEYRRAYGHAYSHISASNYNRFDGYVGGPRFNTLSHFDSAITTGTAYTPLSTSSAIVAAKNKIKNKRVDLAVAFAERKATSRMVGDTAGRLADAVWELRRGKFRNAARRLGIVHDPGKPRGSNWTNHWLQLQYGWKPLLSDVYGSCDALSKRSKSDWRVTSKAARKEYQQFVVKTTPGGTSYPTTNFDAYRTQADWRRGVFVRIDAIPDNDLTMSLASLGVTNPLLVAWEVVPYSFVVDWFLPIGNWLESIDALLGYSQAYYSITTYNECRWVDTGVSRFDYTNPGAYVDNSWNGSKRVLRIDRTTSSGNVLSHFPSFKDPRSLGHMANGLSLLAQAFGR